MDFSGAYSRLVLQIDRAVCPVRSCLHAPVQVEQSLFQPLPVLLPTHPVRSRCCLGLRLVVSLP